MSSWYVAQRRRAGGRARQGPCPHRRRGAGVPAQRAGVRDAGPEPRRGRRARCHEPGLRRDQGRARPRSTSQTATAATTRDFFLGVDGHLLDFGERVARDLASADVAASLTRVFSLERAQHEHAREASVYIAVLASGEPQDFSEWIGAPGRAGAATSPRSRNTATAEELAAFTKVMGHRAPMAPRCRRRSPRPRRRRPSTTSSTSEQTARARPCDRRGRRRDQRDRAARTPARRCARCASTAAPRCSPCCSRSLLIWFVSRAVVGPIRRLTAAAREMSQRQLPALVESLRTGGDVERDRSPSASRCNRRTRSASSPRRSTTSRR